MYNFLDTIKDDPARFNQISCDELLITHFNCPLSVRIQDIWSDLNYFVYAFQGKRIWHTSNGQYEVSEGDCIFVKKGGSILESFFDGEYCVIIMFLPDEFITSTIKTFSFDKTPSPERTGPVIPVESTMAIKAFFQSMLPYFSLKQAPDSSLLRLKFEELLLNVINNPNDQEIRQYFGSLMGAPQSRMMMKIMEDNYCYNLSLEAYAKLCNRSLSAFKRDFKKIYGTSPGKWLLKRRLEQAGLLLATTEKNIADVVFDCGFENASHFTKAFKAQYGITPIRYRMQELIEPVGS